MEDREELIRAALMTSTEPGWALLRQVLCLDGADGCTPSDLEAQCLQAIAFRKANMRQAAALPPGN